MNQKDKVLIKGLIEVGVAFVVSYLVFTPAILIAKPSVGKAFALGVPPMVLIALSWMVGAWWALDKSASVFTKVTLGMVPVRVIVYSAWVLFVVLYIPEVPVVAVILSSIAHWIVFMIPEMITFVGFSKIKQSTSKVRAENKERRTEVKETYEHLMPTRLQSIRKSLGYKV